jgi:hypothetical protein
MMEQVNLTGKIVSTFVNVMMYPQYDNKIKIKITN